MAVTIICTPGVTSDARRTLDEAELRTFAPLSVLVIAVTPLASQAIVANACIAPLAGSYTMITGKVFAGVGALT